MQFAGYFLIGDCEERFDEYCVIFDDGRGRVGIVPNFDSARDGTKSRVGELLLNIVRELLVS